MAGGGVVVVLGVGGRGRGGGGVLLFLSFILQGVFVSPPDLVSSRAVFVVVRGGKSFSLCSVCQSRCPRNCLVFLFFFLLSLLFFFF